MRQDVVDPVAEERLQLDPEPCPHRERRRALLEPEPAAQRLDDRQQAELGSVGDAVALEPDDASRRRARAARRAAASCRARRRRATRSTCPRPESRSSRVDGSRSSSAVAADERCRRGGLETLHRTAETPDGDGLRRVPSRRLRRAARTRTGRRAAARSTRRPRRFRARRRTGAGRRRSPCRRGRPTGASAPPTRPTATWPLFRPTRTLKSVDAPGRLDVARVLADDLDDVKRRPGGALGVVLVGDRDAEEGGDPVAHVRRRPRRRTARPHAPYG